MNILESFEYRKWFSSLRDKRAMFRINARIRQIKSHGALFGDVKLIGDGIYELRFHFGPGYRVYATLEEGGILLLLLAGGDKSTQKRDILEAQAIARRWRSEHGE